MDAEYAMRKRPLLEECQVPPAIFHQGMPRLATFMVPFVASFGRQEPAEHAQTSVRGLLSHVARQNIESIASRCGHDRLPLQRFMGWAEWDDALVRQELRRPVAAQWGQADGVLVCDPSALPTSGAESVGVARQWCGRLGQVDHCQVARSRGDVSATEQSLVDMRLSRPKAWTNATARLDQAGVPQAARGSRSRHPWALERLQARGAALPHEWIAGDDAMGRPYWFRRRLAPRAARERLAVPSPTWRRDHAVDPPASRGRGRPPPRPWPRVDRWSAALPADAWTTIDVRDGAQGPWVVERVTRRGGARTPQRQEGHAEVLVVRRYRARASRKVVKVDVYLSHAEPTTPLGAFARVAKADHRMAECLQRSKSAAGLADSEVRHWPGWHQHQTLAFIATWFVVTETRRGKKRDPG